MCDFQISLETVRKEQLKFDSLGIHSKRSRFKQRSARNQTCTGKNVEQEFYFQHAILAFSLDNFLFVLHPVLFVSRGIESGASLSSEYKLTKLILQIERPFYHLTSSRESALIQNTSAHIPKVFYQHGIAGKAKKIFRHKCFSIANCIACLYWK